MSEHKALKWPIMSSNTIYDNTSFLSSSAENLFDKVLGGIAIRCRREEDLNLSDSLFIGEILVKSIRRQYQKFVLGVELMVIQKWQAGDVWRCSDVVNSEHL